MIGNKIDETERYAFVSSTQSTTATVSMITPLTHQDRRPIPFFPHSFQGKHVRMGEPLIMPSLFRGGAPIKGVLTTLVVIFRTVKRLCIKQTLQDA